MNEMSHSLPQSHASILYQFTDRLYRSESLQEIYDAALDTILPALGCSRASILLFDADGVMRFVAWRGLSDGYRAAVDGHSPWKPGEREAQPIYLPDIDAADESEELKAIVKAEGIRSLAFIPLTANGAVIGKFMTYHERPHRYSPEELELALTIARQLGFSIDRFSVQQARTRAEESLRTMAAIIESSDDAIVGKDLDGIVTSWNEGAERLFGYTADEVIGKPVTVLFPPDRINEEAAILRRIRRGERIASYETVRKRKDGSLIDVSLTVSPVMSPDGRIVGASKIARDVTARKKFEAELRRQRDRFATLNHISRALSSDLDLERIVQSVTDSATKLSGAKFGAFFYNVTGEEGDRYLLYALSGAPREAFEKFGLPRRTAVFEPTFSGAGVVRSDDIRADERYGRNPPHRGMPEGHLPVVSYLAVPVISRSGEVHGGLFFGHDRPGVFTEETEEIVVAIAAQAAVAIDNARLLQTARREVERRRLIEGELRESEERFRTMANTTPAIIWTANGEGEITFHNQRWLEYTGLTAEENARDWATRVLHPDDLDRCVRAWNEALRQGTNYEIEVRNRRHDGEYRWFLTRATPIRSADGRIVEWYGSTTDIHDRKQAEDALRESEQRLQLALEAGNMGAWEWDLASGRVMWSPTLESMHGLKEGSFGGTFEDFKRDIHADDLRAVLARIDRILKSGDDYHVEYRINHPDGSIRWLEAFGKPVRDAAGRLRKLAGICTDVTDRKQAEEQRTLLIHELNHRVKNTLATVQSLATQTWRNAPKSEEARVSFEARLASLSRAHDVLTVQSWGGASLREIVFRALGPFQTPDNRIFMDGPEVRLSPKQALALSMALHELATNAAKYGALSNDTGRVEIEWRTAPRNGSRSLQIVWAEQGGPSVSLPKRTGFGSRMIERNLANELGGEVSLEFRTEGVVCRMSTPLGWGTPLGGEGR